jgi:glycosyltransferase involved in cell wall biosynthesis
MVERLTGSRLAISSHHDILRTLTSMQTASKLILYRVPNGREFEKIIAEARRLSIEVCYDIDDPVFDLETVQANPNLHYLPKHVQKALLSDAILFNEAMRQCDLITVSTTGLQNLVKRRFGNVRCYVVQNGVDTETIQAASIARNQKIPASTHEFRIILASGSLAHEADTEIAAEGLRLFLDRHPKAQVSTIGHVSKGSALRDNKQLKEFPQMGYSEYLRILGQADAAIVPLAPGAFNNCKSIVRLIDAAAVDVPVIASPVGEYAEPQLSSSYLSAKSPEDWCNALETIASDRAAATSVSREAYLRAYQARLLPVIWERLDPYVQTFFSAGTRRSSATHSHREALIPISA